ncbi:HLA class II histocompatibility antigen, DM beta chain [Discoglossus pictus]
MTACSFGDKKEGNVTFYYLLSFNRLPMVEYSKKDKMFIPQFPGVGSVSLDFNKHPEMVKEMEEEEKRCAEGVKEFWESTVERTVQPSMMLYLSESIRDGSSNILVCHIWGFYPQDIKVAWIKNDETVLGNYTGADTAGDWTYRILVTLDVTDAQHGDSYECVAQHSSLSELMVQKWSPGLTFNQTLKIGISTAVFALGFILIITGVSCWRMAKKAGYTPMIEYDQGN